MPLTHPHRLFVKEIFLWDKRVYVINKTQLISRVKWLPPRKMKNHPMKENTKLNLLNAHILVDDSNLALYMREIEETKQFYFAKNPPLHTLFKDKMLYVYLRITQTNALTPMFFDKFALLYEPM